jgi:halimadienyl-diphosphate synthase
MYEQLRTQDFVNGKLNEGIEDILTSLGRGRSLMDSVAYDTAWVARLASNFPGRGFEESLAWLRAHQHTDGSWGGDILHYHDRIISTLAAIIALRVAGHGAEDRQRIGMGEMFLWREHGRMHHDANDTGGYPILALSLTNEALSLGLDIPSSLYHDAAKIEKKLNLLGYDPRTWRYSTLALSTEGLREYVPDFAVFVEADGSVAASPASTAAALCSGSSATSPLLNYLHEALDRQQDGGVPFVTPFDIYECAWTLNHLRLAGAITPDHPEVRRILDFLWQMWSPEKGVSFASSLNIQDLDDTAVSFTLLRWGGYPADANVFAAYEDTHHFRCWANELDPSLSVNIRTLAALQMDKQHSRYEQWRDKIAAMLRHTDLQGYFWFDKWHISPYYLTATAIWSLHGVVEDLLPQRIQWILKTQRADGGWGYYYQSTAEETAYCLQALLYWNQEVERVDSTCIHAGARYLMNHANDQHFPQLWIGKCLYMPRHLVRSAILMALYSYSHYSENA